MFLCSLEGIFYEIHILLEVAPTILEVKSFVNDISGSGAYRPLQDLCPGFFAFSLVAGRTDCSRRQWGVFQTCKWQSRRNGLPRVFFPDSVNMCWGLVTCQVQVEALRIQQWAKQTNPENHGACILVGNTDHKQTRQHSGGSWSELLGRQPLADGEMHVLKF